MTTTQTMLDAQTAQDAVSVLEAQRVKFQNDHSILVARMAEIRQIARGHKVKLAGGSVEAGAALEKLDRELLELGHKRDGIRLALDDLEQQIAPLHRTARERAVVADAERQDREVSEFTRVSQQLTDSIVLGWRNACRDAFELMSMVEQGVTSRRNLDETHRSQILSQLEKINNRFVKESTAVVNENWKFCRADQFRSLKIVPARKVG